MHIPSAGLKVLSKMAVVRWGIWIIPEVSKAAIAFHVGALKAVVTFHTQNKI